MEKMRIMNLNVIARLSFVIFFSIIPNSILADSTKDFIDKANHQLMHGENNCSTSTITSTTQPNSSDEWAENGFTNTKIQTVQPKAKYCSKEVIVGTRHSFEPAECLRSLEMTIVWFDDKDKDGWKKSEVIKSLETTAAIYATCQIRVKNVTFVSTGPPPGNPGNEASLEENDRLAKLVPLIQKPIAFFMRADNQGDIGYSYDKNKPVSDEAKDSIWMMASQKDPKKNKISLPHEILAHELGHVLGFFDEEMTGKFNLMSGWNNRADNYLTPEQCSELRKSTLLKDP
jgi:hypothetical protein